MGNSCRHLQQQQAHYPTMKAGLLFFTVAFLLARESAALECYVCSETSTNIACSSSTTCSSSQDSCLKAEYLGIITRTCGNQASCDYSSDIYCCSTDLCNGSSRIAGSSLVMMLLMMVIPASLALIWDQMFWGSKQQQQQSTTAASAVTNELNLLKFNQ